MAKTCCNKLGVRSVTCKRWVFRRDEFLKRWDFIRDEFFFGRDEFLFGFESECNQALNLVLLELKILNFYSLPKDANLGLNSLKKLFLNRIRKIMLQEKNMSHIKNKYDEFEFKWEKYTAVYDWRGPDLDHV